FQLGVGDAELFVAGRELVERLPPDRVLDLARRELLSALAQHVHALAEPRQLVPEPRREDARVSEHGARVQSPLHAHAQLPLPSAPTSSMNRIAPRASDFVPSTVHRTLQRIFLPVRIVASSTASR